MPSATLPPYNTHRAQSDLPGSVVAQAGGRSSFTTIAPKQQQQQHNKPHGGDDEPTTTTTAANNNTPLLIGLVLLAVVAVGGVTVWRQRQNGSSTTATKPTSTIAQVLANVSYPAARDWMLTEDRYAYSSTTTMNSAALASRIRQRYTVVAVWFASNDASLLPDRDTSECTWEGVACEGDDNAVVWRLERSGSMTTTSTTTTGQQQQYLPDELATFVPQIREISLTQLQFRGPIPSAAQGSGDGGGDVMSGWQQLTWLELSRNQLTGTIPPDMWTLPNLKFLYLDDNQLTGRIARRNEEAEVDTTTSDTSSTATGAVSVSSLRQVRIFANQLTGPLPTWWGELYQLEHWIAYANQMTGSALPDTDAPPPPQLTYYDMSSNLLSGRIPPLLWSATASDEDGASVPPLQTIYLEHNRLTGPLPPSSQRIPTLQTLYLHNNTLTGTIPNNFASNWMELQEIRLGTNAFDGTIPTSLWSHPTLQRLDVSENQLEGTLPTTTASSSSSSLNDVQLHNNRFAGTVPTDFGTVWTQLQTLRLDGNPDLTGTLGPADGRPCTAVWPNLLTLAADCRSLLVTDVPTITCECCTFCA